MTTVMRFRALSPLYSIDKLIKDTDTMTLFDKVSEDIKDAMKARDKVRLMTLRNIKKVFLEAKTAPGANDTLEDAAALKLLQKLAKQRRNPASCIVPPSMVATPRRRRNTPCLCGSILS